jgi:hypothetical protein
MAASEKSIAELRQAVNKARRNALRKRRRFQTPGNDYVQIEGTKYDPIRPPHAHDKYTRAQLTHYLGKLQTFNARKTQFVPDAKHQPIPLEKWNKYKKVESAYNAKVEEFSKRFDSKARLSRGELPPSASYKIANPDHMSGNSPVNGSKRKLKRKPSQIMSEQKLDRLTRNLMKSFDDKNMRRELGTAYNTAKKIIEDFSSDPELMGKFMKLTAEQFDYFWHNAPAEVNEFFLWYESAKAIERDGEDVHPAYLSLEESAQKNVSNFLDKVQKKIPDTGKPARVNKFGYMQPSIVRTKQQRTRSGKVKKKQVPVSKLRAKK